MSRFHKFSKAAILLLSLILFVSGSQGCTFLKSLSAGGKTPSNPNVYEPQSASQSPDMDFTKIDKLGIFPLFSTGGIQNQQFAQGLVSSMTTEIKQDQSQWKIVGYIDIVRDINKYDLGKGYKNLQADFNSFGSNRSGFVTSGSTKEFLKELQQKTGCDSFLLGSYTIKDKKIKKKNLFTGEMYYDTTTVCEATLTLFRPEGSQRWWQASWNVQGSPEAIQEAIGKSAGANIGKGTLQQL